MRWRLVWKFTKGLAKVMFAAVLVALLLPFLTAWLMGPLWRGPR